MRRLFAISILFLCLNCASPQEYKTTYKVVTVISNQSLYLNGGARADFGGKSRDIFLINLPPNTVEWYYAFSSTPNQSQTQNIGLATQLMKFIDPEAGMMASVLAKIISPTGAGVCDVYVFKDQASVNNFRVKQGQFNYLLADSRENFKQGVVQVRDAISGPFIIGLKNPSAFQGISVNLEIAAIVAERKPIIKSEVLQKATLYGELGWKAFQGGDYEKCLEYSKKAILIDSTLAWVENNIALTYLITGKAEAMDVYIQAIELMKQSSTPKKWLASSIHDLDEAKAKIEELKYFEMIRGLLMDEYKKY